ncbi:GNAT family acetyltransferase [Sphingomonas sp. Leaf33]|uniref:GNAT family acetyltransferase n=1 Tax=Sphingomonas sp. Leaf33 TaxID=1736215 RepID=UPI002AA2ABBC|nr:GNAT family acetyltransferase [Sphingomonas sp. Leaf33]
MTGTRDRAGREPGPGTRQRTAAATPDSKPSGGGFRQRHSATTAAAPQVEAATAYDREAVVALWRTCDLTRPWNDPDRDFLQAVSGATSAVLVVRDGEGVTGSVMVGFDGHRGWVYYVAVHPKARRAGLGRALMAAAEEWLISREAPKIQLMVREGNEAATGFYEALGLKRQPVVTFGRFLGRVV